eukprot:TRINITY_DN10339_c0_g1_i3.p1 TRINITY_DN10339_c0_g1~~TRINITY_DN10339_c0_g1_i3.p1  ORF type:complete len:614 (+),score=83.05 TRINITY_DN10339_c0_g1_i3:82-1923(+)
MSDRSRSPRPRREEHHRRWLSTIEVSPGGPHQKTLLYFHGFMGDAKSYADCEEGTYWPRDAGMKVLLVNAPQRRVTCSREVTNAWYDYITDRQGELCDVIDTEHFDDVVAAVHRLMKKEFDVVGPGNVILAGYSQGGTVALHAGLMWKGPKLGGIYAISTTLLTTTPAVDPGCKVWVYHGLSDEVFPWHKWAREGWARLLSCGTDLELNVQDGIFHVDDVWEAAVIRKCFQAKHEDPALKLERAFIEDTEIEPAWCLEATLRAARCCTQLMERFEAMLANVRHQATASKQSSLDDLVAYMKNWHKNKWVQTPLAARAGGPAHFDLKVFGLQSGPESSCWPLPEAASKDKPVPKEGAVVVSIGIERASWLAYVTRTLFYAPVEQQRVVYRLVCKLLEFLILQLRTGANVAGVLRACADLARQQIDVSSAQYKGIKQGHLYAHVWAVHSKDHKGASEPQALKESDVIDEGAYLATAGFEPFRTQRLSSKQAPHQLDAVWLQDTVWVQGHEGGATLTLTQNAHKEEACVMIDAGANPEPKDDLVIATRALSDIRAILSVTFAIGPRVTKREQEQVSGGKAAERSTGAARCRGVAESCCRGGRRRCGRRAGRRGAES